MLLSKNGFLRVLLICLAPIAAFSAADVPELLKPLSEKAATELLAPTNFGLRKQLFFAKRFRIVDLDVTLLERATGEFTVTPFPDVRMRVLARRSEISPSGRNLREFVGELIEPKVPLVINRATGEAVELRPPRVDLWIRSGNQDVPVEVASKLKSAPADAAPQLSARSANGQPATVKMELTTVSGEWTVPALRGATFVIRPIDDDPRFHIIYEVDQEKMPKNIHSPDPAREKYREFIKQLDREREVLETESEE